MINNLLTIICISLLLAGGISTEHKNVECRHDHLITVKVQHIDCAHNNSICLECTDNTKSNIVKTIIKRVSVNKKNVVRNNATHKCLPLTDLVSNCHLPYTISSEPPGNLIIHRFLASVIILT